MSYNSKYLEFNLTKIKFKLKENDIAYIVTNLSNELRKDQEYDSFASKYI